MIECPSCTGPMNHYDGGEAANYEAEILICQECGHEIDLAEERLLPEEDRQHLNTYITVH
jgi:uncharacterized protein YbaR (Trm112 family)